CPALPERACHYPAGADRGDVLLPGLALPQRLSQDERTVFMKRILVAEDEDVIRDFVVINLRRSGYEVVDVPNGDEALRVFDENGGDFDICLLDIMMPGKDGFTVCKEIRKRSATVGIIMLSAKSQEMDKVGALMFG